MSKITLPETEVRSPVSYDHGIDIVPLAGRIGAEIRNVRLSGNLPDSTQAAIRHALLRYKVLAFRGQQHLDDPSHEDFGRRFGDLVPHPTEPS